MSKPYLTIDDLPLSGKTAILRVDINSPIEHGKVAGTDRIEAAAETLDALAAKGAKVVVLAHQGRKGGDDFTSLAQHAEILARAAKNAKVAFVPDTFGQPALAAISKLKPGEAVVLENVRGLDDETKKGKPDELAQLPFVATLAKAADFFVLDAFSAAHRSQSSLVGFPMLLPAAAGVTMDRELAALAKAVDDPEQPAVYFLGGAKPEDSMAVMEANFKSGKLDTALLGGLVGELFLVARGQDLGAETTELLRKKGLLDMLPRAQALLDAYDDKIWTPIDVGVKTSKGAREEILVEELPTKGMILDIGPETITEYEEIIADAGSLMMNGPAGLYEEPPFDRGTHAVLQAFAESEAFSLMGGGHTTSAIHKFDLEFDDFGYVSLAGGALMSYLTGESLPGVEALKESKKRFGARLA